MREFFIKGTVFLLGILIINIYFNSIINELLYKPYSIDLNEASKFDSFMLSDSHGKSVFQEDLTSLGIYNLSFNSDSYIDIYIKLNYLITNKIKVKRILLTADEHTLSPYRETGNNNSRSVFLANFSTYKEIYNKSIFDYFNETIFLKYFALLNSSKSKLVKEYLLSDRHSSGVEKDGDFKRFSAKEKKEMAIKRVNTQFINGKPSGNLKLYLNKILSLCKINNISVYGIKFPLSKDYLDSALDKSYHSDNEFVKNNIQVLDFRKIFIKNDNYFKNQDHLNKLGSRQFSKILKTHLKTN